MSASILFIIHDVDDGERISTQTAPLMPSVEWDEEALKEIDSLTVYRSYELNENNELILMYTDPELDDTPETRAVLEKEQDQLLEILARATGKETEEVAFELCPCLVAAMMSPVLVIGVSFGGPSIGLSYN